MRASLHHGLRVWETECDPPLSKVPRMSVRVEWARCSASSRVAPQDYRIYVLSQQIFSEGTGFFRLFVLSNIKLRR